MFGGCELLMFILYNLHEETVLMDSEQGIRGCDVKLLIIHVCIDFLNNMCKMFLFSVKCTEEKQH